MLPLALWKRVSEIAIYNQACFRKIVIRYTTDGGTVMGPAFYKLAIKHCEVEILHSSDGLIQIGMCLGHISA